MDNTSPRTRLVVGLALFATLFAVSLAVYRLTLAPTVTLVDSGELILAAYGPGIAHPPGFPLYVLLGWLFSRLPLGSVAVRLNLMSAVFAALAVVVAGWAVGVSLPAFSVAAGQRVSPHLRRRRTRRTPGRAKGASPAWLSLLPPVTAALCLAFSLTLWNWATVAEVYTLNVFLTALLLALLLLWRRRREAGGTATALACGAALVYGLGLANHHVTILLLAPAIAGWLLPELVTGPCWLAVAGARMVRGRRAEAGAALAESRRALGAVGRTLAALPRRRVTWLALLCLLAGLSVYAYLPLRAAQQPLLNWGDPSTLERLWWHVTAKQYRVNLFSSSPGRIGEQLVFGLGLWARQFTPLGLAVAGLGLWALWRRDRRLLAFTVLVVLFDVLYAVNYDIAEDGDAYYLPAFLMTAVWIGWGAWAALAWARKRGPTTWGTVAVTSLLLPALALGVNYRHDDKSRYYVAYDYATNTLNNVATDGLLFTDDWQLYSPLLYLQHVERLRPDVTVVDVLLLQNRSWYAQYLRQNYPNVVDGSQAALDAFLEQLSLFEHDRLDEATEIQPRYQKLVRGIIITALASRPVYFTTGAGEHLVEQGVLTGRGLVPEGLAFRLYPDDTAFRPHEGPPLELRGLADGSIPLDEVARQVRTRYAQMITSRGMYLMRYQRTDEAMAALQQAIALDDNFILAHQLLGDLHVAAGQYAEAVAEYQRVLDIDPHNDYAWQAMTAAQQKMQE